MMRTIKRSTWYTLVRLLAGAAPALACELDVQLNPGDLTNGLETMGSREDQTNNVYLCEASERANQFLLAVRLFRDAPPLQLSMCIVFDRSYTGSLSIIGWTRRLRPDDRRAYGDLDLFGGPAIGFVLVLDQALYWTSEGPVEMTISLHGDVVDKDFLCGRVEVEFVTQPNRPLGEMTFAAQRLDTSTGLPDPVAVDCLRGMVRAF